MAHELTDYQKDLQNRILEIELENAELSKAYVQKRLEVINLMLAFERQRRDDYIFWEGQKRQELADKMKERRERQGRREGRI